MAEKYFETTANPGTLAAKASRMKGVSNDTLTEAPEITDALGGGTGGLFPADPVVEIPKVTVDPVVEIHKEVVKEKGSVTQPGLHCHNLGQVFPFSVWTFMEDCEM